MNLVILSSHGILEYDDLRMFTDLGHDVFMPGGYENPSRPVELLRPALPDAPYHENFARLCQVLRAMRGEPGPYIDWAKARLHPEIVDWADAIIVEAFPEAWIGAQWRSIRHKRVIWRTIGQSSPETELAMRQFKGLEIVRYSPAERRCYETMGVFAGEDALIRFAKYPADWGGWTGEERVVGNLAQHGAVPHERDGFLNWAFFEAATVDLPVSFAGRNSETIGGLGSLSYEEMREYLRRIRAYLYTGTHPASYTLGLIEAMMTGTPIVSIGAEHMALPTLFEGHELAIWAQNSPEQARIDLERLLNDEDDAWQVSQLGRQRALDLFSIDVVGPQWHAFLGGPRELARSVPEAAVAA